MGPGNEFDLKQKTKEKEEIVVMAIAIITTLICLVRVTVASLRASNIAYDKRSRLVAVRGQHFYLFSH